MARLRPDSDLCMVVSIQEFIEKAGEPDEDCSYTFELEGQMYMDVPISILDDSVVIHLGERMSQATIH